MSCLQLALLLDREECLQLLFNSNLLDLRELESQEESESSYVDLDFLQNSKNTLEMFIREVTLTESVHGVNSNASSHLWNSQDVQEDDYLEIHELLSGFHRGNSQGPQTQQGSKNSKNSKKHKYLSNTRIGKSTHPEPQEDPKDVDIEKLDKEIYSPHQEGIRLIQKNVRGWLLRRQYLDIKYATRILQNCLFLTNSDIRGKIHKKNISNGEYKEIIKSKLIDWLKK